MTPIDIVSVSAWQQEIDWQAVRSEGGYRGAILRLTRGSDEIDSRVEQNIAGAREAGLLLGFYHRYLVGEGEPDVQALHFATQLMRVGALDMHMLPPVLDYEDKQEGQALAEEFLDELRGFTGRHQAMIYTSGSYVEDYLGGEEWMDPHTSLWIADSGAYTDATPGKPAYSTSRVVLHQHSGPQGDVPGFTELVDVNVTTEGVYLSELVEGP